MVWIRWYFVGFGRLDICHGWTVFLLAEVLNQTGGNLDIKRCSNRELGAIGASVHSQTEDGHGRQHIKR